jgi:hypothetical protein
MKFCGVDDEKANSLLKPGDLDQPLLAKEEPKVGLSTCASI